MQASEPCLVKIKELKANMSVEVISVPSTAIGSRESTFFERGDAPAQAVIHANAQARSLRKAAETQEELREVSDRVSQTLSSYQLADTIETPLNESEIEKVREDYLTDPEGTLEVFDDLTQLMIILGDPVAKKKYQQQVTIFIVGYENLCGNRAKNSKEEDAFDIEYPDFDIDEVGKTVKNALDKADQAQEKLTSVSQEIVKVLENVNPKEAKSRKKKLEKALQQSKEDIIQLSERLIIVQKDLENNEGKLSQLYKTLEGKTIEIEKLKGHVETGKRKAQELDELKDEMVQKNTQLQRARQEIDKLKVSLAQSEDKHQNTIERQKESREARQRKEAELEDKLKEQQQKLVDIRKDMDTQNETQLKDLRNSYQDELKQLKEKHSQEIKDLKDTIASFQKQKEENEKEKMEAYTREVAQSSAAEIEEMESRRGSTKISWKSSARAIRMVASRKSQTTDAGSLPASPDKVLKPDGTMTSFASSPSPGSIKATPPTAVANMKQASNISEKSSVLDVPGSPNKPSTSPKGQKKSTVTSRQGKTKSQISKSKSDLSGKANKSKDSDAGFLADKATQTEIFVPEREKSKEEIETDKALRKLSLTIIPEDALEHFEKDEEVNWDAVPIEELPGRFAHYRKQIDEKQAELDNQLSDLKTKYNNKVQALKGMMEIREKWSMERDELVSQLESAKNLQEEAENEAETAMLQLEELLAEQDEMRLELERQALALKEAQTMTSPLPKTPSVSSIKNSESVNIGAAREEAPSRRLSEASVKSSEHHMPKQERTPSIPTIVENDVVVPQSSPDILSPPASRERLLSSRARQRLVNSALNEHPVVSETMRAYNSLISLKDNMIELLEDEDYGEEAELLKRTRSLEFEKNDNLKILEQIGDIRRSTTEIIESLQEIIPRLVSSEEILFSNVDDPIFPDDDFNGNNGRMLSGSSRTCLQYTHPSSTSHSTTDTTREVIREQTEVSHLSSEIIAPDQYLEAKSTEMSRNSSEKTEATKMNTDDNQDNVNESLGQEVEGLKRNTLDLPDTGLLERSGGSASSVFSGAGMSKDEKRKKQKHVGKEGRSKLVSDYKELINKHQSLTESYEEIKRQIKMSSVHYEEQLTQNAQVMQEMQGSIDQLKEQLSQFQLKYPLSAQNSSSGFMFTRLDMEHNARALKRGLHERRLSYEEYDQVCEKMDDYISLPAQRFAELVKKYAHHVKMQQIEQAIRKSKSLDEEVFDVLDKMEDLQSRRTMRWEERMEQLASDREELAKLLVRTLEMIEQETGIFLIKPIMSAPRRPRPGTGGSVVSTRIKSNNVVKTGALAPASRPKNEYYRLIKNPNPVASIRTNRQLQNGTLEMGVKGLLENDEYVGSTWQASKSFPLEPQKYADVSAVPKMLELDVNRSMFANNQVSTKIGNFTFQSGAGPIQSNLLSYVTVARPSGSIPTKKKLRRHDSSNSGLQPSPPPSPFSESTLQSRSRDLTGGRNGSPTAPLPPIRSAAPDHLEDGRSVSTYLSDADRRISPISVSYNSIR